MSQTKRTFSPRNKVYILRHHLLDKSPISEICDEYGIRPTLFYRWQKEFFENGEAAFQSKKASHSVEDRLRAEIKELKNKLQDKNEVVSELMEDYLKLKKRLGEK